MAGLFCVILLILTFTCTSTSGRNLQLQIQSQNEQQPDTDSDTDNGMNGALDLFIFRKSQTRNNIITSQHGQSMYGNVNDNGPYKPNWQTLKRKIQVGTANLNDEHFAKTWNKRQETDGEHGEARSRTSMSRTSMTRSEDEHDEEFIPGQQAMSFTVNTIKGILQFPSPDLLNMSIIFHVFDNRSAFLQCLWTSNASLESISGSPDTVHYMFMSSSNQAKQDALWMYNQLNNSLEKTVSEGKLSQEAAVTLQTRLHFVTQPTYELGNWLPAVLMEWACQDHGCGFTQVVFKSTTDASSEFILKRLDARYDWLPSPTQVFSSPQSVVLAGNGCSIRTDVANHIALVIDGDCSFADKVKTMEASSAVGVIVYSKPDKPVQDMNCEGIECDTPPNIPATMIPYNKELLQSVQVDIMNVSFQKTPSENFYFAIDRQGLLAEMGWLLYPSFQFFVWQAQWFDYKTELLKNLSQEVTVVPVINDTIMQGHTGVIATVNIPPLEGASKIELDVSLSCPGIRDKSCPPWDHTVQLFLCCDKTSPLCGMELGRWITSFRRRIGRWLTDVTPLAPLFTSTKCTFTMKSDAWWAQPWKPSLNLRIHKSGLVSTKGWSNQIMPLFQGGTFNQSYNAQHKPINFTVPQGTRKVIMYAVITGHGSDNNGCGEFCITSHHFIINNHPNVNTFTNAGTPTGCAERSGRGVEPNEHGTWLYGRDGWCDGREVDPWVVDVTSQINIQSFNFIKYFGWFNGTDPNPTANPGSIIMYSYLVMYQ